MKATKTHALIQFSIRMIILTSNIKIAKLTKIETSTTEMK